MPDKRDAIGMMISGRKTASVYKRYRIVPENDIRDALQKVEQAIRRQKSQTRTNPAQLASF
jgi:hypothetical protein